MERENGKERETDRGWKQEPENKRRETKRESSQTSAPIYTDSLNSLPPEHNSDQHTYIAAPLTVLHLGSQKPGRHRWKILPTLLYEQRREGGTEEGWRERGRERETERERHKKHFYIPKTHSPRSCRYQARGERPQAHSSCPTAVPPVASPQPPSPRVMYGKLSGHARERNVHSEGNVRGSSVRSGA